MSSLLDDFRESLRHSEFWGYSTWLGIITDYRRMRLGLAWLLIPPLVYILGIGYLYQEIVGRGYGGNYFIHLGMGWALWQLTSRTINGSAEIYTKHKSFILDGHIRFTDYVLRAVSKALFRFIFSFAVVFVILLLEPTVHWYNMLTMVGTIPLYVFNLVWVAVAASLLGARYPDVREFLKTILMLGHFVTPIIWSARDLPPGSGRKLVAEFNPAFHFVRLVRGPAQGLPIGETSWIVVACMTVGGWLLAMVLYRRFARFIPLWT